MINQSINPGYFAHNGVEFLCYAETMQENVYFTLQFERQKKEREHKKKQEALTLEETKEQIAQVGLVVMGGDSFSKGREFKSRHHSLGGHFFHIYLLHKLQRVFEKTKINEKEAGVGPFLKNDDKRSLQLFLSMLLQQKVLALILGAR